MYTDVYGDNSGESDADSKPQRSKLRSSATSG